MRTRERMLPVGWYPASVSACKAEIEHFIMGTTPLPPGTTVYGGIVPHAGWHFSGKAAARVFSLAAKARQPQVVCVFGGHLGGNSPPLLVADDAWETPLGDLTLATEFYQPLAKRLTLREESPGDNTIEVQMPFVKYFFPQAKVLALRAPHSEHGHRAGPGRGRGGQRTEGQHPGLRVHRPDPLRPQLRLRPQGLRPRGGEVGERSQ